MKEEEILKTNKYKFWMYVSDEDGKEWRMPLELVRIHDDGSYELQESEL